MTPWHPGAVLHRHVIWDWNGTLLDDFDWIVRAVNAALSEVGASAIDGDGYRDHFTRPIRSFYERLLGGPIEDEPWSRMQQRFEAVYRASSHEAALARDALPALEAVRRAGATQSLLSMLRHTDLVRALAPYRLGDAMLTIDGYREGCPSHKASHLGAHLDTLHTRLAALRDGVAYVLIGDSVDDALAAAEHGVACVLYDGGSHHRTELDRVGVPVAASLLEALRIAGLLAPDPPTSRV